MPGYLRFSLFLHISDVAERYLKAMGFAAYKRERLLNERQSMIVETVLSRPDKLDFIQKARSAGYRIVSVFVGTSSPAVNVERGCKRVREGGHNVPEDKIVARYARSMENVLPLSRLSNEFYLIDNSGSRPILSASVIEGEIRVTENAPEWVRQLITKLGS